MQAVDKSRSLSPLTGSEVKVADDPSGWLSDWIRTG